MPMHNSRRAVIEAQCYLERKRQNISKEDLERVKAFAEMYQPRVKVAAGSEDSEPRGTKRSRPTPIRQHSPSCATRAYPSPSPSPSPSPLPSSSSFASPKPPTPPYPAPRSPLTSSQPLCTPRAPSALTVCINAIREWIMALLALLFLARSWWSSTIAWFTFMFTATFGALSMSRRSAHGGQLDPRLPATTSVSFKTGLLRIPGSGPGSKSIVYTTRRAQSDQSMTGHLDICQRPLPPPSPILSRWTPVQPPEIHITSVISSDEEFHSRRILASFGYDVNAYETCVEDDGWGFRLAQHLAWQGRPSSFGVALNAALDSSLSRLAIVNCSVVLDDVIAILHSCENLETLEVQDVTAMYHPRSKLLLPRQRYVQSPSKLHHHLKTLRLASAIPFDSLFSVVKFCSITHLTVYGYDAGCKITFPSHAMRHMRKTLKTISLLGDYRASEIARLKEAFPRVTCNGS